MIMSIGRRHRRIPTIAGAVLLAWATATTAAFGQDETPTSAPTGLSGGSDSGLQDWSAQTEEFKIDADDATRGVYTGVGAVQFRYGDIRVRCDSLVVWWSRGSSEAGQIPTASNVRPVEIYAEGTVIYRRQLEVVVCYRLFLDVVHDRGVFDEASLSTRVPIRDGSMRIVLRGRELRELSNRHFEAIDATVSTCEFGEPHYHIKTSSIGIRIPERHAPPINGERPAPMIEVDTSVLYAGSIPVFVLPPVSGSTAGGLRQQFAYVKSVDLDTSGKFGPSIRIGLGDDIYVDDERWGEFTVSPQYLGDRGPGLGFDLSYKTEDYRGEFEGLYQNDHGTDELFGEPPQNDRGRALFRHRHKAPEHIQLDFEGSYISDEGFLPEYYESEFKSGKEQESLFYLKRALENRALTFLARGRVNDFQDQTEYLPQVGYNLIEEPLFDIGDATTVYFDADYEGAFVRRKFNKRLDIEDYETYRVDLDSKIETPFLLGPVKATPYAGFRYTRYGDGRLTSRDVNRVGEIYGVRLFSEFSRTWHVDGGLFDLYGLRHIVLPEVSYEVVQHVSSDPDELLQFDAVDQLDEEERIRVGLRNRIQTIWTDRPEPEVVDIFDIDLEWSYYPQSRRDNFGEHAGNFEFDGVFRPSRHFMLVNDFEYSFVLDKLEVFNVAAIVGVTDDVQFVTGYRRYTEVNDAVFLQLNWRMSERWQIGLFSSFDFEEDRYQDQRIILRRIGHDWVFGIEISYDQGDDDFGFGISFEPRALFDPRLRSRFLRNQPEFGSFEDHGVR